MAQENTAPAESQHPYQARAENTLIAGGFGGLVGEEAGNWIADKVSPFLGHVVRGPAGYLVETTSNVSITGLGLIIGSLSLGFLGYCRTVGHQQTSANNQNERF